MNVVQKLVKNILDTKFEDFDRETVVQAKYRIIDTIGAAVCGANAPGCSMVLDIVREWGGKKESTILAYGDRVPAANAALVNGIMARSWDCEAAGGVEIDGRLAPGHFSATSVPTALAIAEQYGIGGRELITSIIVGDDLAVRMADAGGNLMGAGWDPSGLTSRFGAAATAGRMMGLNEKQLLHALGIVLNQTAGTMACVFDGTHCFKIHQGLAGWNGIFSAELARRGFTGPHDPLQGKFGFFDLYCSNVEPSILTKQLGKTFYADSEYKIYPCCRGNHAAIESALKLVHDNNIEPDDIAEVTILVPPRPAPSFLDLPFEPGEVPQVNAALNLHYTVADAVLRKSVILEHFTDEFIMEPEVLDLAGRIKIEQSLKGRSLLAGVRIKMKKGKEFTAITEYAKGNMEHNPLTKEEIYDKFLANVEFSRMVSQRNGAKALEMLDHLEEIDGVAGITKLLKGGDKTK